MEEKYYLISGKALANVNFRISKKWYKAGEKFVDEKISDKDLNKYRRFFELGNNAPKLANVIDATVEVKEETPQKNETKTKSRSYANTSTQDTSLI